MLNSALFIRPHDFSTVLIIFACISTCCAFSGCKGLYKIEIPNSVQEIGCSAFGECEALTDVVVPMSVTKIGESAFGGCTNLRLVSIYGPVKEIESWTFVNCVSLQTIILPDTLVHIGENSFRNCSSLFSIVIPDTVLVISEGAFQGCSELKLVKFPKSLRIIDDWAFSCCPVLSSIDLPCSLLRIGDSAFYGCSKLVDLVIPNAVIEIGIMAFGGCISLVSVVIPESVVSIWNDAFFSCWSLREIHSHIWNINDESICDSIFGDCNLSDCSLYVPLGSEDSYKQHPEFSRFKEIVAIDTDDKTLGINENAEIEKELFLKSSSKRKNMDLKGNLYNFHNQIKEVVGVYGEDFLEDENFIEIIGTDEFPIENSEIYDIITCMIKDSMITRILYHETNSWDEELTKTFKCFAKKHLLDEAHTLYIARSFANAVNMEVDLGVVIKQSVAEKQKHLYSASELCDKIVFLRGKDTTAHAQIVNVRLCPYQRFEFDICIHENECGYDGKPFCIHILVKRPDDSIVFSQSSGQLDRMAISQDDSFGLCIKLRHKLYLSDHVSKIEIITSGDVVKTASEIDFSYIRRYYDSYEGYYYC